MALALAMTRFSVGDGNEVVTACERRSFRSKTTEVLTTGLPLDDDNNVVMVGDDGGFDGDSASGCDDGLILGRR